MLIMLLFQKFIVYIMNNLCAKFGCHISSNNRDKPGQIRLKLHMSKAVVQNIVKEGLSESVSSKHPYASKLGHPKPVQIPFGSLASP